MGTVDQIMAHMEDLINNKKDAYAVLLQFGDTYNASNSGDFQKAIETKDKIMASVEQKLNEEYADTLDGQKLQIFMKRFHFNLLFVALWENIIAMRTEIGISDNEVIEVIQWRRNQNRHRRGRAGRAESVWREQKRNRQGIDGQKIHLSLFFVRKKKPVYFSRNPFYTG